MDKLLDWLKIQYSETVGSIAAPTERIFWFYLASAFGIGVTVLTLRGLKQNRGFVAAFTEGLQIVFDPRIWFHASAKTDYFYFFINKLIFPLMFGWLGLIGLGIAASVYGGLLSLNGGETLGWSVTPSLLTIYTVLFLVAMDFGLYVSHTAFHKVPLLWEFHKVHHSAQVLTPITVYRQHPIDDFVNMTAGGIMTGICSGIALFCVPDGFQPLQFAGLHGGIFLFYVLGYNLRHSHIWVGLPLVAQSPVHQPRATSDSSFCRRFAITTGTWDLCLHSGIGFLARSMCHKNMKPSRWASAAVRTKIIVQFGSSTFCHSRKLGI